MQTSNQTAAPAPVTESTALTTSNLGLLASSREPSPGTLGVSGTSGSQISNVRSEMAALPPLQPPTLALIPATARAFQDPLTTSLSFALGTSNFELRTCSRRRARRHGAIARLPKDCRDLVNRMLSNGVVYRNIVAALKECGHTVSERNISNWYASGYKDWQDDQAEALHHARIQDALLDHCRQTDSSQLAEIGLQTAATRLSEILLQKTIDGEDIESALPQYRQLVDLLCRVNREILSCHKHREDSAIPPQGPTPERDAAQLKYIEATYSQGAVAPDPDTELPPSPTPKSLPPMPLQPPPAPPSEISNEKSQIAHDSSSLRTSDLEPRTCPRPAVSPAAQASAPAPAPPSEISNLKCAPLPNNAVSAPSGTVQKLSPPAESARAGTSSTSPLRTS